MEFRFCKDSLDPSTFSKAKIKKIELAGEKYSKWTTKVTVWCLDHSWVWTVWKLFFEEVNFGMNLYFYYCKVIAAFGLVFYF